MKDRAIRIRGARTHNLADLDLDLPREAWTVVCGVSGSGKSSLVLDTLGAESRRRFLGTLTRSPSGVDAWARPDVDRIEGLPPAVTAGFSARAPSARRTLGTLTEVTQALRAVFARAAVPHCPTCGATVAARTRDEITAILLDRPEGSRVILLAPRGTGRMAFEDAGRDGFVRVRIGGADVVRMEDVDDPASIPDGATVEVVVDRLVVKEGAAQRFAASVDQGLELGGGVLRADGASFADRPYCGACDVTWPRLSTRLFSFDSPAGACPTCEGRGGECDDCDGRRLAAFPRAATVAGRSLPELEDLTVEELAAWLETLAIDGVEGELAEPAREDAHARLQFLGEVGLGYLQPSRSAPTLSGGELRRARLAAACAARMSGLLFLLDEPSAGLHPADRPALRRRLRRLVDEGNTLICVEHDPLVMREVDHALELGPGAGEAGGRVVAEGRAVSLSSTTPAPPRTQPRHGADGMHVAGARYLNLRDVEADFPHRGLTCLTGVSGAGKSTLLLEVLAPAVRSVLDRAPLPSDRLAALVGVEPIERMSVARGAPPRHPRASPGSVLGVLSPLRRLFAATLEARTRGWAPSRFSRHVAGGRCEACRGTGERRVALRDLAPVRVPCDSCDGNGFHRETLKVRIKGLSMADVLALPLEEAHTVFRDIPAVARSLAAAADVGLGYVRLGEPTSRLSGGEALRLRLAAALGHGGYAPTLYLLDEPSAGLHPKDVEHLTTLLLRLGEEGHTVVAVEHHLSLVRAADHVVELGPGPGAEGGGVVYEGPPAGLLGCADSPTGRALADEDGGV